MNEKRVSQQLRSFERLLNTYEGKEPLSRFLTLFFKENKQMGSNDRRTLSRWVYNYFRLGKALADWPFLERLTVAEYLCAAESDVVALFNPVLADSIGEEIDKKLHLLSELFPFNIDDVFPLIKDASTGLEPQRFLKSLFQQPKLFIRIHPGAENVVKNCLTRNNLHYESVDSHCLALDNGVKLDQYAEIKGAYEVQDRSSQQTSTYFEAKAGEKWWDACAASGGKSLLLMQTYPGVDLLVSDVRSSILRNLDERFEQAAIKHYRRKIIDLTKDPSVILGDETFDGIILDAPCSGSGTWGRTPEMMQHFNSRRLQYFVELQRAILENTVRHLKANKPLVYITCSMYRQENEEQIAFAEKLGLTVERMTLLKGYEHRADTMFVARLIKRS
ncbi:RsmB/NOP family class I SAM-dependent RNA methyltransferase [Olivibacter sp. XZL3]|uniref:RsmB/NOP family class I SAM-dependent RNA methyltransferase n=1 Tax=Olivibacter sp. XZL3 TaxID=1735116 RepID=UPI0010651E74|nr:RsmB/NOP family class I SAM-dependent RNA methyltransferase [Olivibacter sp. XZL3]